MKRVISMMCVLLLFLSIPIAPAAAETTGHRYIMRFPDISEKAGLVVFVYGDDIWKVAINGGVAQRLTINDGVETTPKFSPDGKTIAFTGQYDGNSDVYTMNVYGGNITRLTFHPDYDQVIGWHPLKNKIIFQSDRLHFRGVTRLFMIAPDGTGLEPLILHEAAFGSFSPDGKQIAYNRTSLEGRTWKRYRGGRVQDIYLYDFDTQKDIKLIATEGSDRIPMWIGDKIYFSSDIDNILNIYAFDTQSKKIEQLTFHKDYDVRSPSASQQHIIYEMGGELVAFDIQSKKTQAIPVEIYTDAPETRPYIKEVSADITGFHCSPSGKRAVVVARGEVFTVPQKDGATRNLTNDCGARDKDAVWSPDGKSIAYLSDKSGEYDIYLIDSLGKTPAKKLTQFTEGYRYGLRWSPDSKKIAFADNTLSCFFIDVATGKITRVDKAEYENIDISIDVKDIYDFTWSPDSRFIAYSKMDSDLVTKVYVYSLETGKSQSISNGLFNDFHPVFSCDGLYLFFVSNRRFNPTYCDFEWEMVYKKMAGIYYVTLKKDTQPLFPFKSDEGELSETIPPATVSKKEEKKEMSTALTPAVRVVIDFAGIAQRIQALPLPNGNYRYLATTKNAIYYLNANEGDFNRFEFRAPTHFTLSALNFETLKERTVIQDINGYKLSADGTKIVYLKNAAIGIIDAEAEDSKGENLSLADLKMTMNPIKEWYQIFNETWRMERDYYYEPNMKGNNWPAIKAKYEVLMAHASCRQDITYILGEMIAELNTSHTYVFGGDHQREAKSVNVGLLGADYSEDTTYKLYRFQKIYQVPDWSNEVIPPLSGPGIDVKEGDYLLAVNGVPITTSKSIYSYFLDLANKPVVIKVNSLPSLLGAREYTVKPLDSENTLRYQDWVETNRKTVENASNGEIGYIHFPDTFNGSAVEFPKYFYSQSRKKAVILDGRFNGGGLDPDVFLGRFDKQVRSYWTRRYSHDQTSPAIAYRAHFACLTNLYAGSGGDEFPYIFRHRKMGPVIGTRTWGGLVGVSMFIPLIDGGSITAPDYRVYNEKGEWIIENTGVTPDIEVDLSPAEMAKGYDAQLMKAVEYLKEKIKEDPKPWPQHNPFIREELAK